jgi:hypothetical protein
MKLWISTLIGFTLVVVGGCTPTATDTAGLPLPYQDLGESSLGGNAQLGAPVYAATSITQLVSLTSAHRPGVQAPHDCCTPGVKVAKPSLFLAFQKPGRTQCTLDRFSGLRLASDVMTIDIHSQAAGCISFAQPISAPVLLLAVPLAELPKAVIEVRLQGVGDAEQRSHFPRDWSTVADLRRPLAERSAASADIQAGVDAAWNATAPGPWLLGEVGLRRSAAGDKPCGLPTSKTVTADDPLGVVIRVVYVPNDNHVPWIAKQHEYAWRIGPASFLDDCGVVT